MRPWPKRNKFGNKKSGNCASKLESALLGHLKLLEKSGEIKHIKQQVHVKLTDAAILYIADFSAEDCATGKIIYFEAKGFETDTWRIKRRLWAKYGPGPLYIFKGTYKNLSLKEIVNGAGEI